MKFIKILSAGLLATSVMTLFSYKTSKMTKHQFREPQLLATLMTRIMSQEKNPAHDIHGWLLHYFVGILFVTGYDQIWHKMRVCPRLTDGALLGGISGVVGAEVWSLLLRLHPDPPKVNLKKYYRHLLAAHVVFGIFAVAGYRSYDKLIRMQMPSS
jgi:hypothetical protein